MGIQDFHKFLERDGEENKKLAITEEEKQWLKPYKDIILGGWSVEKMCRNKVIGIDISQWVTRAKDQ